MYNTKFNITADSIKKLSMMSILSKKLKLKEKVSEVFNQKNMKNESPSFMWVIRDYSLRKTKDATDFLVDMLERNDLDNEEEMTKERENELKKQKEIKESIMSFFKSISAFYLPVPVSDDTVEDMSQEEAMQNLDKLDHNSLRKNFITEFDKLSNKTRDLLRPKTVNNN